MQGYQVLIFINRRAVHELHFRNLGNLYRPLRQRSQPLKVFRRELVSRPKSGQPGEWIEILKVHQSAGRLIVIPAHEILAQTARALNHFIGAGAVAHDVTQIHNGVIGTSGTETSLECVQIAVDVTQNQNPHMAPNKVAIIRRDVSNAWD